MLSIYIKFINYYVIYIVLVWRLLISYCVKFVEYLYCAQKTLVMLALTRLISAYGLCLIQVGAG